MTTLRTAPGLYDVVDDWLDRTSRPRRAKLLRPAFAQLPWAELHGSGGPIHPISLPHIMLGTEFQTAQADVEILLGLLIRLEQTARLDPDSELWHRLYRSAWPESQPFLDLPWYESEGSMWRRYRRADAAFNQAGVLQFMEMNQVGPQGMNYFDIVTKLAADVAEVIGLQAERSPSACEALLDWLVLEYQERYGTTNVPSCIGVPVEPWWPSIPASIPASAERMQAYADRRYGGAIKLVICHTANLWIDRGRLYIVGETGSKIPCDMLWNNAGPSGYPDPFRPPAEAWTTILRNPQDFLVFNNPTGPRLTRNKDTLAVLRNPQFQELLGLTKHERDWIERHIPRTYHVQEDLGQNPDALSEVLANWQELVFKPSDGGLGQGVMFGSDFGSQDAIRAFIHSPRSRGYVAQWRIDSTPLELLHLSPDGQIWRLIVDGDFCPMIINGRAGWPLCRGKILSGLPGRKLTIPRARNSTHNLSSRNNSALVPVLTAA